MESRKQPDVDQGARTYVRRDIWKLYEEGPAGHAIIDAYAAAVGILKAGPTQGYRSWTHHTEVHGMHPDPQDGLRNQCQHASWYFLPWHRMYLESFEEICRSLIGRMAGVTAEVKETWALPYWDYDTPGTATLPPPFRSPTLSDGRPNPLHEPSRDPQVNAGTRALRPVETSARDWFARPNFTTSQPWAPSFGGGRTTFNHDDPGPMGSIERTPHGSVHMFVGGKMTDFDTAAGDAIFWLHHANIDRLWEVWRSTTGQGDDPTPGEFGQPFDFYDDQGGVRTTRCSEVLDTRARGYVYEDIGVPPSALAAERRRERLAMGRRDAGPTPEEGPAGPRRRTAEVSPEVVGASTTPVRLSAGRVSVDIDVAPRSRSLSARAAAPQEPERLLLVLEHITLAGTDAPDSYVVHLGDEEDDDCLVGTLPLFGLVEAQRADASHGISYVFDITDVAADLTAKGQWDPDHLRLSFRPIRDRDQEQAGPAPEVEVGTVRLLVQ